MSVESLVIEAIIVIVLILINGFFSGAEIAIISSKRSSIETLAEQGNRSAKIVSRMKSDPDRFLATVQVGVTVVGTLASVIGGMLAMEFLKPLLATVPIGFVQSYAEPISVGLIVMLISYGLLVIGELVPKSIGLSYSDRAACFAAVPLEITSKVTGLFVSFLTGSTAFVLRRLGIKESNGESAFVSEEELKYFITEGRDKGILEESEASLLHGIFEFGDTTVREVMVARPSVSVIDLDTAPEEVLKHVVDEGFSRYPVCRGSIEKVVGILFNKDVFRAVERKEAIVLSEVMRPAFFVPDSIMISKLLREMQKRHQHMAIVVDEHGNVDGVATIEDILEEIVGEIEDEYDFDKEEVYEKLKDGVFIIDASTTIRDLEETGLPIKESEEYTTLAGFMLANLQRLPRGGEFVLHEGYRFTIVDVEGKRISKVKAEPVEDRKSA